MFSAPRSSTCTLRGRRVASALFATIALSSALAGCARPGANVLIPTETVAPGAKLVTVYVATTRVRQADSMIVYNSDRASNLNYAEFTIAIPPRHKAGEIEWPSGVPDPESNFLTVRQNLLTAQEFESKVSARSNRKAAVFVHGYNVSFQEAVFRLAQLTSDGDIDGVPILFSWPSEGTLTGYIADKDSATYSRDALAHLLTLLARDRKNGDVAVLGHSMGAWLTAESLRQLRMTGRNATINRLAVVLAAPDIDVDVFRTQMKVIGPLTPPMTVLVSRDDKALAFSSRITGTRKKLGSIDVDDPRVQESARAAKVRVIDISSLNAPDGLNHDGFVTLGTLYSRLGPSERRGNDAGQGGAFVFNTFGTVLSTPFSLVGGALAGQ